MKQGKSARRLKLRALMWPHSKALIFPSAGEKGWNKSPRTLPLILGLIQMKSLSGDLDPSGAYLDLLSRTYDEGFIVLANEKEHAACAGFSGQRAVRSWRERINCLDPYEVEELWSGELAAERGIAVLCGRYKGIDERVIPLLNAEEISIGDYVLSGGEPAAIVILDALARLLPGVLGDAESAEADSFSEPLLDAPVYTRPEDFQGRRVPDVLLSGDHERIRLWRRREALRMTWLKRPDLLLGRPLSKEDQSTLDAIKKEEGR
jgi:tRNA (guanine37-N1)-methyltransferase